MRVSIAPTLGMLLPAPRVLTLGGRTARVLELQLGNVAEIEREFTDRLGHPFVGQEARLDAIEASLGRGEAVPWEAREPLLAIVEDWPPRFGGRLFRWMLTRPEGAVSCLWITLRRTHPKLTRSRAERLATEMDAAEWDAFDRVAFGYTSWETFGDPPPEAPDDDDAATGDGPPDWAKSLENLSRERGWTYAQIGELYLTQYFNICARGEPRRASIADRPPVDSTYVP